MKTPLDERHCHSENPEFPAGLCRKLADSLIALREQLIARYDAALPERRHLVREVIAEAEALAWETRFPHLFLPDFVEARLGEMLGGGQQPAYARAA